jgi:hypothetical protein
MVNEALFRASARARLMEARTVSEVSFNHDALMKIAIEQSKADEIA